MRRTAVLVILAGLALSAPAEAAQKCDFRRSTTVASNDTARVFWVKGRGADKRVYFGCLRHRKPILLATDRAPKAADETRTTNQLFRLAGSWVAFHQTTASDFGVGEFGQSIVIRSLAGARRAVRQDLPRYGVKNLKLAADGSAAWVLSAGDLREVDGVAAGATSAMPLAVARGIASPSLALAPGVVRFVLNGTLRTVPLTVPAPPPTGNRVGREGLDGRFGDCGTLVPASPKPGVFTEATQLDRAPGGALVAAGTTTSGAGGEQAERDTFVVARFSADGKFDAAFGKSGVAQIAVPRPATANDATLTEMVVQPDGRVLLAGNVDLGGAGEAIVMRLTNRGALDPTFGEGGIVRAPVPGVAPRIHDLALTPSGALLVAGERGERWYVARLSSSGTLDQTFGTDGVVGDRGKDASRLKAIVAQDDGTIFAAGGTGEPLLLRLAPDGTLLSISSAGPPAAVALSALEPTSDGGVVASGTGANIRAAAQVVLARYGPDGKPVTSFDGDGFALDPQVSEPRDIAVAPDGGLVVTASFFLNPGGYAGSGLVRYSAGGVRDTTFGLRGALGGTSSFGLDHYDVLLSENGTAYVAQDNGGAFGISRFAVGAPAIGATSARSTVCAMATATALGPMVKAGRIDVSLRLRAPGKLQLDAVVRIDGRNVPAGTVTVLRPYTEGAVASIPLTKAALAGLRKATTAKLTISGGAPGRAKTAYTATLTG